MLDITLSPTFPLTTWQALDQTANLPCKFEDFIASSRPFVASSRRSHSRIHFRGRASMRHGSSTSGVYTIDLSPSGIGLYSPVLLFPSDQVELCFDQFDSWNWWSAVAAGLASAAMSAVRISLQVRWPSFPTGT